VNAAKVTHMVREYRDDHVFFGFGDTREEAVQHFLYAGGTISGAEALTVKPLTPDTLWGLNEMGKVEVERGRVEVGPCIASKHWGES
jgi:hypothetical protein